MNCLETKNWKNEMNGTILTFSKNLLLYKDLELLTELAKGHFSTKAPIVINHGYGYFVLVSHYWEYFCYKDFGFSKNFVKTIHFASYQDCLWVNFTN